MEVPIQNSQFESIQFEPVVIETTHQSEASSSIREEGTARDLEQAYQAKCIEAEQTQAQLLELQRQVAELVARQKTRVYRTCLQLQILTLTSPGWSLCG